ncbi:C39 family peptidase [Brevibacillus fortis]|nr:C39 family peptidase [Brevibacillus fortis]MED1785495.1 C39 family peptidase [Brevibacillus fortis]
MSLKLGNVQALLTTSALVCVLAIPQTIMAQGTGDNPNFSEDIKTEKDLKWMEEKEKMVSEYIEEKYTKNKGIRVLGVGGTRNTIRVPEFEQETYYYCGPATVKQVLDHINGNSNSQDDYASELKTHDDNGTDFSMVDNVLNDNQNDNNYVYKTFNSDEKDKWLSKIEWGVDNNYPTILDLKITSKYMPKYRESVEGHILNTSGYDWEDHEIRLTDPFDQGNRGITLGNTWHPADGVWKANQAHFREAIIY